MPFYPFLVRRVRDLKSTTERSWYPYSKLQNWRSQDWAPLSTASPILEGWTQKQVVGCWCAVGGQNPFAPRSTPWEAVVHWYLQGNHHSRVSEVVQDFVHPQYCVASLSLPLLAVCGPRKERCSSMQDPIFPSACTIIVGKGRPSGIPTIVACLEARVVRVIVGV